MDPIRPFYLDLDDDEIEAFLDGTRKILKSGMLILGEATAGLEREFADFVGVRHAVAVNSGTTALEILLKMRRLEGRTVLVPTNTNFATAAAVLYAGGKVRFLDMDAATFAPSLAMVRGAVEGPGGADIAGVMWVHIGGVVSPDFPDVVAYCRDRGLFALEDCAHAHGSALGGVAAGNLADGGAFSFFPTKVMTTCEGGMITTNSDEEAEWAQSFRNQGKRGMAFGGLHHDMGNSHRITEINAHLGRIQLAKLPAMLDRRRTAYDRITAALDGAGIAYVSTAHMDTAANYKLMVLPPAGTDAGALKSALADRGVILGGTVYEIPCHLQPVFEGIHDGSPLPVAEEWCPRHICPPLTSGMTEEQADRVGTALVDCLGGAAPGSAAAD